MLREAEKGWDCAMTRRAVPGREKEKRSAVALVTKKVGGPGGKGILGV